MIVMKRDTKQDGKNGTEIPVPDRDKPEHEYICPSASWGDMTGLIPAGTHQSGAIESYEEVYPFLPPYSGE